MRTKFSLASAQFAVWSELLSWRRTTRFAVPTSVCVRHRPKFGRLCAIHDATNLHMRSPLHPLRSRPLSILACSTETNPGSQEIVSRHGKCLQLESHTRSRLSHDRRVAHSMNRWRPGSQTGRDETGHTRRICRFRCFTRPQAELPRENLRLHSSAVNHSLFA